MDDTPSVGVIEPGGDLVEHARDAVVVQPGVTGAALLAAYALDGGNLADFIREGIT